MRRWSSELPVLQDVQSRMPFSLTFAMGQILEDSCVSFNQFGICTASQVAYEDMGGRRLSTVIMQLYVVCYTYLRCTRFSLQLLR